MKCVRMRATTKQSSACGDVAPCAMPGLAAIGAGGHWLLQPMYPLALHVADSPVAP